MKITVKVEVTPDFGKQLAFVADLSTRAKRAEIAGWLRGKCNLAVQDVLDQYNRHPDIRKKRARRLNNLGPDLGMKEMGR